MHVLIICINCRVLNGDKMDWRHIKVMEKVMKSNWSNQKANPALKTKTGNK